MTTLDTVLLVAGAILAIGAALNLFDRLLLWMERRGCGYWGSGKRSRKIHRNPQNPAVQ